MECRLFGVPRFAKALLCLFLLVLATENANCQQVRVAGKKELTKSKVRVPNIGAENLAQMPLLYSKYFCLSSGQLYGRPRIDMEQKRQSRYVFGILRFVISEYFISAGVRHVVSKKT